MGFERKQFTFYRSFFIIVEQLPVKKQRDFLLTLIRYALDETEPSTRDSAVRAAFEGLRPVLDKARNKAMAGKIGGEAPPKPTQANGSKPEANRSKPEAEGEIEVDKDIELDVDMEGGGKELMNPPHKEDQDVFASVFELLRHREIFMEDKDKAECQKLCAEYGSRAVLQAIERAWDVHVPRWSYVRAIVTSGGVSQRGGGNGPGGVSRRVRETNAQCQEHGVISDGMLAAAKEMLEEDV